MTIPSSRIDVVGAGGRFEAAAAAALRALGHAVAAHADWDAFARDGGAARVVVADGAGLDAAREERLVGRGLRLVCGVEGDDQVIEALRRSAGVASILAKRDAYDPKELRALARAWCGADAGGVADYLAPGADVRVDRLASYADREAAFDRVRTFAASLPGFVDFPETLVGVAWEMLMNALIDAPKAGAALGLSGVDGADLVYGCDGASVAIGVTDRYGALTRASVVEALTRAHQRGESQVRSGPGGAGVGLYVLFTNAAHLVFSVQPRVRTRVVLTMRLVRRYKEFSEQARSLHFIEERGGA